MIGGRKKVLHLTCSKLGITVAFVVNRQSNLRLDIGHAPPLLDKRQAVIILESAYFCGVQRSTEACPVMNLVLVSFYI